MEEGAAAALAPAEAGLWSLNQVWHVALLYWYWQVGHWSRWSRHGRTVCYEHWLETFQTVELPVETLEELVFEVAAVYQGQVKVIPRAPHEEDACGEHGDGVSIETKAAHEFDSSLAKALFAASPSPWR